MTSIALLSRAGSKGAGASTTAGAPPHAAANSRAAGPAVHLATDIDRHGARGLTALVAHQHGAIPGKRDALRLPMMAA